MFGSLFGRRKAEISKPSAPDGTRIYAIGDLHGSVDALRDMHDLISQDSRVLTPDRVLVVYLGDYVDRGDQSRELLDYLLDEPLEGVERVFLRGNHEEFLVRFLEDATLAPMWLPNGGDTTLLSYGVGMGSASNADERHIEMQVKLREVMPERHLEFIRNLDLYHIEGDYLFVHAGIRPGVPLEEQTEQEFLWIREEFMTSDEDFGHCVVHGHTIVPEAEFRANRISVDTGAYYSNVLSCAVLEGEDQRVLHT